MSQSSFSEKNKTVFDRYYRLYPLRRFFFEVQYKKNTFNRILSHSILPKNHLRVLDLGFGFGELLRLFEKDCEIFGIDISPVAVSNAVKSGYWDQYLRHEFRCIDLNKSALPYQSGFFDLIICSHILEHLENPIETLKEIIRVVRPGGYICILLPLNESVTDPCHHIENNKNFLESIKTFFRFNDAEFIFGSSDGYVYNLYEYFKRTGAVWFLFALPLNLVLCSKSIQEIFDGLLLSFGFTEKQSVLIYRKLSGV